MRWIPLALLLLTPAPCLADAWTDALYTELEKKDPTAALGLYQKVVDGKGANAVKAALRRVVIFARQKQKADLLAEVAKHKDDPAFQAARIAFLRIEKAPDRYINMHNRPDPEAALGKQVSLNFSDTPLDEAIAFLRDITGQNILLLPEVQQDAAVSLSLKNISLRNALKLLLAGQAGLTYTLQSGCILVGKNPKRIRPRRFSKKHIARNPDAYLILRDRPVTLNFPDTPFADALDFLGMITKLKFSVDSKAKTPDSVGIRARKVSIDMALAVILADTGSTYALTSEGVTIKKKKKRKKRKKRMKRKRRRG